MALATGGSAVGAIRIRSRPISWALRMAAGVGIISATPSGNTARTSRARIASLTFSRILGRRGGKFLGGIIEKTRRTCGNGEISRQLSSMVPESEVGGAGGFGQG